MAHQKQEGILVSIMTNPIKSTHLGAKGIRTDHSEEKASKPLRDLRGKDRLQNYLNFCFQNTQFLRVLGSNLDQVIL